MFGEDESESPRMPSPWQAIPTNPSPAPSSTSPLTVTPSSFTRRASYLERLAIEACSEAAAAASSSSGLGQQMVRSTSGRGAFALSLEAEALKMEGNVWGQETLVPESDGVGHIEYKLKLIAPSPSRLQKLTTQLKWRLCEGGGTALYEIGVLDDGALVGLGRSEMDESLLTLDRMAEAIGAKTSVARIIELPAIMVRAGPVVDPGHSPAGRPANLPPRPAPQKKKKGKGPTPSQAPKGSGKPRLQPGDAAVSSSSESESEAPFGSSDASTPNSSFSLPASSSSAVVKPSASSTSVRGGASVDELAEALKEVEVDPAVLEERRMARRKHRDDRRALNRGQAPDTSSPLLKPASPPTSSSSSKRGGTSSEGGEEPLPPSRTDDDGGPRYVVEVTVKLDGPEGGIYLDFEGFGAV